MIKTFSDLEKNDILYETRYGVMTRHIIKLVGSVTENGINFRTDKRSIEIPEHDEHVCKVDRSFFFTRPKDVIIQLKKDKVELKKYHNTCKESIERLKNHRTEEIKRWNN